MKYIPKEIKGNVNVSTSHPLIEFLWLAGGLVILVAITFFVLGFITDRAVVKLPVSTEVWLGEHGLGRFTADPDPELTAHLQELLKVLPEDSVLHRYNFSVYLETSDQVNAIALPGGKIVVFSGLVDKLESENELLMVLGHELGHYAQRDHLRGLGRGLGVVLLTTLLFGLDSSAGDMVANTFVNFQLEYSKEQESGADRFGLELLVGHYGHAGGSVDFFNRIEGKNASKIQYLRASHPHPGDRVRQLQEIIEENNYSVRATVPLDLKKEN